MLVFSARFFFFPYLDQASDKVDDVGQLVQINVEMVQFVASRLVENDAASFSHRTQASEVPDRIKLGIRRPGEIDLGQLDW